MLYKESIIKLVKDLDLPPNEYWITSGAALVIDEIEFIDGLPIGILESINKQKLKLGREKDIKDTEKIDKFIKINYQYASSD
jgi:hypothetical protein